MKKNKSDLKFLFAGGGTGGHLFPAVAVAEKIRMKKPEADILFIGSKTKIEAKVVPGLGFRFKSVWIKGFARRFSVENILFPFKVIVSIIQSLFINMVFKPNVAIGSGGYVAGPAIFASSVAGAKIILLEQNSYPGVTTRLLERFADEIHLSFEDSGKYFRDQTKLFFTGTPVRQNLASLDKKEAKIKYDLNPEKKLLLVLGGSLGAASINNAVAGLSDFFKRNDIQVIWQTGINYFEKYKNFVSENIRISAFIDDMNLAYSACDLLLARAGATTIAELLTLEIPAILVPSPNVAANHQYFNAKSLADADSAVLIKDNEIQDKLKTEIESLIFNEERLISLSRNAKRISKPDAAEVIADKAIKFAEAEIHD